MTTRSKKPTPYAALERLVVPRIADTLSLWHVDAWGRPRHAAGGPALEPPPVPLEANDLMALEADGKWVPRGPGSMSGDDRTLALALPETRQWLIVQRAPEHRGFEVDDLGRLREIAILAAEADQCGRLAGRLRRAREIADRASHRWATVARASNRLAQVTGIDETLTAILEVTVPYLADYVILDLVHPPGEHRRMARHVFPDAPNPESVPRAFPFGDGPVSDGIASLPEEGQWLTSWDDATSGAYVGERDRLSVARLAPHSLAVLPLMIGGERGGAMTLVSAESRQEYSSEDLDVFRQIAGQAGLALTTAVTLAEVHQARQEREEVLAIVSHDLKNPLNVLRFATSLLRMPGATDERKQTQVEVIDRAVTQMSELINDLLDASRIDAGRYSVRPGPMEPEPLVREAVEQVRPLADKEAVILEIEVEPDLPLVFAERGPLLRVLGNLLANAITFTPPQQRVWVRARAGGDVIYFEVCDEGPGLEPELREHMFDRYWQARRRGRAGAGLGLTIARGIVLAHGGSIDVDSEVGVGTTVCFTIPVASNPNLPSEINPAPEETDADAVRQSAHHDPANVEEGDPGRLGDVSARSRRHASGPDR